MQRDRLLQSAVRTVRKNGVKVRFADCQLDTDARRLERGGEEAHLSPKAFEVLTLLIGTRPRAVSKAELFDRVWPETFVTEASLARVINEIRAAIGDRARDGGVVRTVHGYGYAFAAEIEAQPAARHSTRHPICWLFYGAKDLGLPDGEHVIGRDPAVAVCLDSPKVSRHHARITVSGESAILEDLSSKNGVFVRGERITDPTPLRSGDEIRIGSLTLVFRVVTRLQSTETEVVPRAAK